MKFLIRDWFWLKFFQVNSLLGKRTISFAPTLRLRIEICMSRLLFICIFKKWGRGVRKQSYASYAEALLFICIFKKWDQRYGNLSGTRDPRLVTHLIGETWDPRSKTLNVEPKTRESWAKYTRPNSTKLQTGIQDLGHLSCLWFDTQEPYQNPVKYTATIFQNDISSDIKAQDLNSMGQEKFA